MRVRPIFDYIEDLDFCEGEISMAIKHSLPCFNEDIEESSLSKKCNKAFEEINIEDNVNVVGKPDEEYETADEILIAKESFMDNKGCQFDDETPKKVQTFENDNINDVTLSSLLSSTESRWQIHEKDLPNTEFETFNEVNESLQTVEKADDQHKSFTKVSEKIQSQAMDNCVKKTVSHLTVMSDEKVLRNDDVTLIYIKNLIEKNKRLKVQMAITKEKEKLKEMQERTEKMKENMTSITEKRSKSIVKKLRERINNLTRSIEKEQETYFDLQERTRELAEDNEARASQARADERLIWELSRESTRLDSGLTYIQGRWKEAAETARQIKNILKRKIKFFQIPTKYRKMECVDLCEQIERIRFDEKAVENFYDGDNLM